MTSFIERKVNEVCGRWLDGFTKDNVDVSLLQAKITLSDLHFKTDELCLLSPTFAPSFFYVGKLSIDIPLSWDLSRPVKLVVSDVLGVVRVRNESMTAEDARKSINASVHVKALLSKLAAELGGGEAEEGKRAARINVQTVHNIHKVLRKLEITVKHAHIRVEEPRREVLDDQTGEARDHPAHPDAAAVAFGVCLRGISLGMDERAAVEDGGGSAGERWFGKKFRAMETALLGNFSRYDSADGALSDLQGDAPSDAQSFVESDGARSDGARSDGADGNCDGPPKGGEQADGDGNGSGQWKLAVNKFASVRGASVYFCRDEECYSGADVEETLRRLREDFKSPPTALPPLLRRCRAGVGLDVVFSAKEWGKIESLDVRLLAGDIHVQVGDVHLGYLLRWTSLLNEQTRSLALSALRPTKAGPVAVAPSLSSGNGGRSEKSRYYRALWRYAVEVVLRDLRSSVWQRFERARQQLLQSAQASRGESIDHNIPWSSEESEYRATRGLLWRTWFAEWVGAARYLSVRQLIQSRLVVESFADESGGIHNRLYEDLEVEPTPPKRDEKTLGGSNDAPGKQGKSKSKSKSARTMTINQPGKKKLGKYLMPWQLPQEDVDKAWSLINRSTFRWELREAGGIKQAIEEERADNGKLDAAVVQALWSIQLQLDAQLPHRICAFCRRMAFLRVGWRSRIDRLWQARAEKQRRLGLGLGLGQGLGDLPTTPPRLTANGSLSMTASEMGFSMSSPARPGEAAAGASETTPGMETEDDDRDGGGGGGDGADRVGTLLVRMGQLDGITGVGLLSLAPKAVATLLLEESSATIEEMDLETNVTEVAKYDPKNDRCFWNQTFRLQVELNEDYVHNRRRERMKKHRRISKGGSCGDLLGSSTNSTPSKSDGPQDRGGRMGDATCDATCDDAVSPRGHGSLSPVRNLGAGRRRPDSIGSTRFQVGETSPLSSFLLAVSCVDKNMFGVSQLGKMTLPGKQLTAVPLKVLEHRCALFSPVTAGQQLRELTLETIFVPPGEDVVLAERKLSAIGRQRYLEDKLNMAESSSSSSSRRKASPGSAAALERSPSKPPRSSLDNVGEREMKVISLEPARSATGVGGSNDAPGVEPSSGSTDGAESFSSQRSIPIVDTEIPGKVTISMRAAGVTVVTYLGHGGGSGLPDEDPQDMHDAVVTLTETSAREIEACAEIDATRGNFSLALEAATIQLLDRGLMQSAAAAAGTSSASAETANTSQVGGSGRQNYAPLPQLMTVGPVRVEVASTRYFQVYGNGASRPVSDQSGLARYVRQYEEVMSRPGGDDFRPAGAQGFPATPMTPTSGSRSQSPSAQRGGANAYESSGRRDGRLRFWDALGSWPMWDWRGRLKIGAYTAELGKCNDDRPGLEEVWRRFRFSMPKSALEDTQVLRRGLTSSSGAAQSSIWLLKAGARGIAVDVQMPINEQTDVSRAPSPKSYVYVSSSESDTGSPLQSPSSSWSSSPAVNRGKNSPSRTPSRLNRDASAFFPDTEEECTIDSSGSRPPHASTELPPVKDRVASVPAGSGSRSSISELSENEELKVTPSNAELLRRVQELEEELETLREAAAATAAVAGVVGSSSPVVAVEGGETP